MKKNGLRSKLIRIFIATSTIPLVLMGLFMTYSTVRALKRNTASLTQTSLKRTDDNIKSRLEAYEDLLYQIYTNDDVVTWTDKLNENLDVPVTINQLRRYLQGLLNTKDAIRSLTLLTDSGMVITYDQMTPATYKNSWINSFRMTPEEIYSEVSADYKMHVFSTEYGTRFANKDYYLFHIAHRIIDYRSLDKICGVVVMSLDVQLLEQAIGTDKETREYGFLVDSDGRLIAGRPGDPYGEVLYTDDPDIEKRTEIYAEFARLRQNSVPMISVYHDEGLGWDIVNATDQTTYLQALGERTGIIIIVCVIMVLIAYLMLRKLSGEIMDSVDRIVAGMKEAEAGNLKARIPPHTHTPSELEIVGEQFNDTLSKLEQALQKEKEAIDRQRVLEIRALEAQINPHFLYNTLDTINWMAIDREEYDISNAINALATILRYAITDYDGVVTIRDEVEWLKKYVYLQQFRLKNQFHCRIDISPELMDLRMHKLLLQPFVENAIIHGFRKNQKNQELDIKMSMEDTELRIVIRDNGRGIDPETADKINSGESIDRDNKEHIGLDNALLRLHMYCSGRERIYVSGAEDQGTEFVIIVPVNVKGNDDGNT